MIVLVVVMLGVVEVKEMLIYVVVLKMSVLDVVVVVARTGYSQWEREWRGDFDCKVVLNYRRRHAASENYVTGRCLP